MAKKPEDKKIYNIPEQELLANEYIDKFYKSNEEDLEKVKQDTSRYKKITHGKRPDNVKRIKGQKADVFPPETFNALDTDVNSILQMIYFDDKFFIGKRKDRPEQDNVEINTELTISMLEEAKFKSYFKEILWTAGEQRLCVLRFDYEKEEGIIPFKKVVKEDIDPQTLQKRTFTVVEQNVKQLIKDGYNFRICRIEDLYFDKNQDIRKIDEILEIRKISKYMLKIMEKKNIIHGMERLSEKEMKKAENGEYIEIKKYKDEYEVGEYWGMQPLWWSKSELKDKEEGEMLVLTNIFYHNDIILGIRTNPRWYQKMPYLFCPWINIPNEMLGIGLAEITEKDQIELADTRNLMLDHKNFSLYAPMLKNRHSGIANKDLLIEPLKVIEGNNVTPDMIRQLVPDPRAFQEGAITTSMLIEEIRHTTGATSPLQGIASTKRQTKGEIDTLTFMGSNRLKGVAITIAEIFLKDLLNMAYWYNQQYINKTRIIQIVGKDGVKFETVYPNDIVGEFEWIPKLITDSENRQAFQSKLIGLMDIAGRTPPALYGLLREIFDLSGIKNANELIPPPPQELEKYQTMPEEEQNMILAELKVDVPTYDNDTKHLESHVPFYQELVKKNMTIPALNMLTHIYKHFEIMQAKQQQTQPQNLMGMMPAGGTSPQIPTAEQTRAIIPPIPPTVPERGME